MTEHDAGSESGTYRCTVCGKELTDPKKGEQAKGVSFNTALSVFGGDAPRELLEHWDETGDLVYRPQNAGWF